MTYKKLMPLALLAVLSTGAALEVKAQSAVDGAIGGTVEDSSGAIVGNAQVIIRSNETNATQTVKADGSGFFRAIHLQPGVYTVSISAPGFEAYKATNINVTVGSLATVEPRLTVGAATETVEVTTANAAINTTNNDFSNTIDLKVLEDLPVNNYRWSSYALLTPGVVESGGFGLLSFRGQSTLLNNVTFDGADDNQAFFSEERGRTRVGYSTAKSSIQEFQVNTSNYSVEYGRSAGGVVNAVTRSGTNAFHGEAYFFDRDAGLGAKNPFTTHAVQTSAPGAPLAFTSQVFKPKDWRKQTGLGIGGPIIKDKLFFFFAFDKFLRNFPGVSAPSSPGQFYATPTAFTTCTGTSAAGVAAVPAVPASPTNPTGKPAVPAIPASVNGAVCQLAVNLNGLAKLPIDVALATITATQYNAASTTYTNGIAGLNSNLGTTPRTGDQDIFFPKIDWQINGRNHATFELNRLRWTSPAGIQTSTSALNLGTSSFGDDFVKDTFLIGKLDTAITARLSNEVRYQYGRDFEYETPQKPTPYENATVLNPAGYTNPYQVPPNVSIGNAFNYGTPTFLTRPAYPDERRWQLSDTVNFVRGNHNFKFGIDFLHTNDLSQNLFSQFGSFSYGGSNFAPFVSYITDLTAPNLCASKAGAAQECYSNFSQAFGPLGFEFQTKEYAGFLQDEWKASPRLSITMGVRYEYEQTPQPQIPFDESTRGFVNGSTGRLPDNRGNIGPRVGFAYDVFGNGKTSIRGGYGMFYARLINSTIYNALAQTGNARGQLSVTASNSNVVLGNDPTQITTKNPSGAVTASAFPQIINPKSFTPSGSVAVFYFDKNFKLPEIHQADLTIEQDLGWSTTVSASYLGAWGKRLPNFVDTNLPQSNGTVSYTVAAGGILPGGTVITLPYYNKLPGGNGRPDSRFGATTDIFSGVNSDYEALVVQVTHKTTRNLSFSANYTYSHALDYGENNTTFTNTNSLFDPANIRADYGNSNQNIPNRVVAYAVYNTPSRFKGIYGYLLNNYELAPSFSAQNGAPYSAGVTGNFSGIVVNGLPAGYTPGAASSAGGINGTGGAARVPGLDRNIYKLRKEVLLDFRVSKRFKILEKYDAEILAESFNIFNHLNQTGVGSTSAYGFTAGTATAPNMLTPNSPFATFDPTSFTGSANSNFIYTPRQVQLGARIQF